MKELFYLVSKLHMNGTETLTPPELVEEMLDRLPPEIWSDTTKRFLDPAMGTGTFYLCLLQRLDEGLKEVIPDRNERLRHIMAKQLFGCEIDRKQLRRFVAALRHLGLEYFERNVYNEDSLQKEWDMKFDVVVGNPPYNPPKKGNDSTGNKIWHKFVEIAYSWLQAGGWVAFVTPTTWRHGDFNKRRQHRYAQDLIFERVVLDWQNAKPYFPMVGHSIGIDWWISGPGTPVDDLARKHRLLPSTPSHEQVEIINSWLAAMQGDCYEKSIKTNDHRRFSRTRGPVATTSDCVWKHVVTGAKTRVGIFDWYDTKSDGFDQPKVIIFDSSGPRPFYDARGEIGCGHNAHGYPVFSDEEAQEIMDFFESDLYFWMIEQLSEPKALGCPTFAFKRIPKSWRELEKKYFS